MRGTLGRGTSGTYQGGEPVSGFGGFSGSGGGFTGPSFVGHASAGAQSTSSNALCAKIEHARLQAWGFLPTRQSGPPPPPPFPLSLCLCYVAAAAPLFGSVVPPAVPTGARAAVPASLPVITAGAGPSDGTPWGGSAAVAAFRAPGVAEAEGRERVGSQDMGGNFF